MYVTKSTPSSWSNTKYLSLITLSQSLVQIDLLTIKLDATRKKKMYCCSCGGVISEILLVTFLFHFTDIW